MTQGLIRIAEAYPFNEELVSLQFTQAEEPGQPFVLKEYLIRKADAAILATNLNLILAAPDTQSAWQQIADSIEEDDPDWENMELKPAEG